MTADLHIYEAYPRKAGKAYALRCIQRASARLQKGEAGEAPCSERQALVRLYRATKAYAESRQGRQTDKARIPHPSTFFNQGRYLDDPADWDVVIGEDRGPKGRSGQSVDAGRAFLEEEAYRLGLGSNGDSPASTQIGEGGLRRLRG